MIEATNGKWATFLPSLLACVAVTDGPVLELGMGYFSSETLHAVCGATNRLLVSVEQNPEWAAKFTHLRSDLHEIHVGEYDPILTRLAQSLHYPGGGGTWGCVLVDESPGGARRASSFRQLINLTAYLVCHDFWGEQVDHIGPLLAAVPYHHVSSRYEPPTLIASMTRPIPEVLL